MEIVARVRDARVSEPRIRAYGFIDGRAYRVACPARNGGVRAITIRRAHREEMDLHIRHV